MNEHRNCTCPASKSGSFQIATDHYSRNFIPTGWKLEYTSLEQHEPQRFLYMTGWCLRCGGQDLQSGISIPDELSGDALLERIYREMEHYRPFEHRRSDGTYNRSLLPAGSPQISGPARTAQVQLFHHCLPGHELRCPPLQGVLDAQEAPCPGRVPG